MDLDKVIRKVPNFPKPGITFYDVTSIFMDPDAFHFIQDKIEEIYTSVDIDGVVAVESRGFIVASPFALNRSIPLVLARKKGKLPGETIEQSYSLEYGEATLEMQKSDIPAGKKWLIIDDLIATGGTLRAVADMIERQGGKVSGIFSIIGLPFLNYMEQIEKYNPVTLIDYDNE